MNDDLAKRLADIAERLRQSKRTDALRLALREVRVALLQTSIPFESVGPIMAGLNQVAIITNLEDEVRREMLAALGPAHPDIPTARAAPQPPKPPGPAEPRRKLTKKLRDNDLDLQDMLEGAFAVERMGPIEQIVSMIPGLKSAIAGKEGDMEAEFRKIRSILQSMTLQERRNPTLLNKSRRARISRGCGHSPEEIEKLEYQFRSMNRFGKDRGII